MTTKYPHWYINLWLCCRWFVSRKQSPLSFLIHLPSHPHPQRQPYGFSAASSLEAWKSSLTHLLWHHTHSVTALGLSAPSAALTCAAFPRSPPSLQLATSCWPCCSPSWPSFVWTLFVIVSCELILPPWAYSKFLVWWDFIYLCPLCLASLSGTAH